MIQINPILDPGPARRAKGFTLIELLVVVAIIAMLIAMLLPSLNQARAAARLTVCASNMRQVRTALEMYSGDNHQSLPGPGTYGQLVGYSTTFTGLSRYLAIYLSCREPTGAMQINPVFICPSFPAVAPAGVPDYYWIPYGADGRTRTGKRLLGDPTVGTGYGPARMGDLYRPSAQEVMHEIDELTHPGGWGSKVAVAPPHGYASSRPIRNWLMFDGHIEARIGP
jgi:prepilin-type N-terminal cleavage/methylation domain-containing protein